MAENGNVNDHILSRSKSTKCLSQDFVLAGINARDMCRNIIRHLISQLCENYIYHVTVVQILLNGFKICVPIRLCLIQLSTQRTEQQGVVSISIEHSQRVEVAIFAFFNV